MANDEVYLDKLLRGETMGINLYEKYLNKLSEGKCKREVENFREEHLRHKTRIESMMKLRDIEISSEIGIQGKMAEAMTSIRLVFKNEPKAILQEIHKGELMGVKSTEMYLDEFSEDIRPDIEKFITEDKNRISRINKLIENL